jgi:hypothetical protein
MGAGSGARPPIVVAVRVTPWPITSRFRILGLAVRTAELLRRATGDARLALRREELSRQLRVDGRFLGAGYGRPSAAGRNAQRLFAELGPVALDTTYSAKAAAALPSWAAREAGPIVFWSTKSTVPLPRVSGALLDRAPSAARRWIIRAEQRLDRAAELPGDYERLRP